MEEEVWKPVPRYEKDYEVSNYGNIRTLDRFVRHGKKRHRFVKSKPINKYLDKTGYWRVDFYIEGKRIARLVHQLVALAFVGERNDLVTNHLNGIKTDNRPSNLEYCTIAENMKHAWRTGLIQPWYGAKISINDVVEIKKRLLLGESIKSVSIDYDLSASQVRNIKTGHSWGYVNV